MRVALYARYSSDQQRAASIEDQLQTCRRFAAQHGWDVAATYTDAAVSGASLMRAGIQSLMRDATSHQFDIVVAEALDRFSRDQEDTAGLHKRLTFSGVRMVTVSEGEIGHLHVGLKGTMNAMFLHDLAEKTRRGLRGRVEAGRSGGGVSYGYRVVRVPEGQSRGGREVDSQQAAVVGRIFRAYLAGVSPKQIAKTLNAEGIPGPMGVAWSPSTIHGHSGRGTGILNNELYIGRIVWNRQRFVKDPDTGKRQARPNPPSDWIRKEVPELRILSDDVWQAVKARQDATRRAMKAGMVRGRRPKYLFSGLTTCETCGGGFILSSRDTLACFNAESRGTCTNRRKIKRQEVEARVLRAMRERFFEAAAFEEFCRGFADQMETLRKERLAEMAGRRRELANVEREIRKCIEAIKRGVPGDAVKDEITTLHNRKLQLTAALAEPPSPAMHPEMADVFRRKTMALTAGLQHDDQRDAARQALRGFVEKIVIPPGDGLLQVVGKLAEMLTAAQENTGGGRAVGIDGCGGRI